jgi:Fe2+ or Zn2+ uptake regulation protein
MEEIDMRFTEEELKFTVERLSSSLYFTEGSKYMMRDILLNLVKELDEEIEENTIYNNRIK